MSKRSHNRDPVLYQRFRKKIVQVLIIFVTRQGLAHGMWIESQILQYWTKLKIDVKVQGGQKAHKL